MKGCKGSSVGAELRRRNATVMTRRPSLDGHAGFEASVHGVFRYAQVVIRHAVVFVAAHGREEHAFAVDGDFEFMRVFEAGEVADDVLQQNDIEVVVCVQREVVFDADAAASAQRQTLDVAFLREIRRDVNHGAERARIHVTDGERRDFARGDQVLIEEGRRYTQRVGDVIEAVAFVIGRKIVGGIDLDPEQIANGVGVFVAIQAMQWCAARIGLGGSMVEGRFEILREGLRRGSRRFRHTLWRHLSAVQFTDDLLPHDRIFGDVIDAESFEHEAAGFGARVVTTEAIGSDQFAMRVGGRLLFGNRWLRLGDGIYTKPARATEAANPTYRVVLLRTIPHLVLYFTRTDPRGNVTPLINASNVCRPG